MRAYILSTDKRISPFGDPVSRARIGNRELADIQRQVLTHAGLEVVNIESPAGIQPGRFLLTYDDVFFTRRVLNSLLKQASKSSENIRAGLPAESLLVSRTQALQDLHVVSGPDGQLAAYRLFVLQAERPPRDQAGLDALLAGARTTCVRFKEKVIEVPTPPQIFGAPHYDHPLTSSVILHLNHWVHVLWANQLSIQIRWVEEILDHKLWTGRKLAVAAASGLLSARPSAFSTKWAAGEHFNRFGRNCDIHPTARVEFSQLGDNVRVGAFALVRGCLLDDGVQIEDRANVVYSVVGQNCFISKNSTLVFCAGYPEADLCANGIQCCLVGSRAALTSFARVIDLKTQGDIQVMHAGKLHSAGTNFLGACFGHDCFVGMDVTIQAGRELPNQTVLVKPPDEILRKVPADLPAGVPAWVEDGTLVTGD